MLAWLLHSNPAVAQARATNHHLLLRVHLILLLLFLVDHDHAAYCLLAGIITQPKVVDLSFLDEKWVASRAHRASVLWRASILVASRVAAAGGLAVVAGRPEGLLVLESAAATANAQEVVGSVMVADV